MSYEHPIRKCKVNVWQNFDADPAYAWIAMFDHGRQFPIWFHAGSRAEVIEKAEKFRAKTIAENESAYQARQENAAKARAARVKRKAAV